ncbi:MAG: energy transducer TonB [Moheibacter sp.]
MKQLLLFSLILLFDVNLLAQEQKIYTLRNVKEMVVFQGCEKIPTKNKKELNSCMFTQLSQRLFKKLEGFPEVMKQKGIAEAKAKIQFIVSKEGVIIDINALEGSHPLLAEAAVRKLTDISEELSPIRPSKLNNGEAVNTVFQLPIKYQVDPQKQFIQNPYPVDEIVLFTLIPDQTDYTYEVRLYKNKDIKVYEVKDENKTYLGKFLSMSEIERSDPYKSLIAKERTLEKTFITKGYIKDELYEIYIYNLFRQEKKKPIYVEVLKVEETKRTLISTFKKEEEFNQSQYAPLIYRE